MIGYQMNIWCKESTTDARNTGTCPYTKGLTKVWNLMLSTFAAQSKLGNYNYTPLSTVNFQDLGFHGDD